MATEVWRGEGPCSSDYYENYILRFIYLLLYTQLLYSDLGSIFNLIKLEPESGCNCILNALEELAELRKENC